MCAFLRPPHREQLRSRIQRLLQRIGLLIQRAFQVANKIQQRNALEAEAKDVIDTKVKLINDLKNKLTLLTTQETQAVDAATVQSIETRKRGVQQTIEKETAAVEKKGRGGT